MQNSSNLLQTLFARDLVDELWVWTYPVVLGGGKRLFEGGEQPGGWTLVDSTRSTTGLVIARYQRASEVPIANSSSPSPRRPSSGAGRAWSSSGRIEIMSRRLVITGDITGRRRHRHGGAWFDPAGPSDPEALAEMREVRSGYRRFVYPVAAGGGARLFLEPHDQLRLRLVEAHPFRSGVAPLRYRRD